MDMRGPVFAITACEKFSQLNNKEVFRAWLLGIARNKCNDYFRRKAKELEIPLEEMPEQELSYGRHGVTVADTVRETLSTLADKDFLLDIVGRYNVAIGGKKYDTVCVMDIETYNAGVIYVEWYDCMTEYVL